MEPKAIFWFSTSVAADAAESLLLRDDFHTPHLYNPIPSPQQLQRWKELWLESQQAGHELGEAGRAEQVTHAASTDTGKRVCLSRSGTSAGTCLWLQWQCDVKQQDLCMPCGKTLFEESAGSRESSGEASAAGGEKYPHWWWRRVGEERTGVWPSTSLGKKKPRNHP